MTRILLVESEGLVARDLQACLEELGYRVAGTVESGEDAIAQAAALSPDLVLTDTALRGPIDGISAAEHIYRRLDIPVVILSDQLDEATMERIELAGTFGYLEKPFRKAGIRTSIEIALFKHRMERALKSHQKWLATTLKSIGDGVIATDEGGAIVFMNRIAEAITGWSEREVLGRQIADVMPLIDERDGTAVEHPVMRALQEGVRVEVGDHVQLVARGGGAVAISDAASAIRDDQGVVKGSVFVFCDVTERRRGETLREGQNQILELIAANAPLPDVLLRLTKMIESEHHGMLCSVLLLDEDGVHVRHGAAPSLPESYVKAIDGAAIGPRTGSCGTAMYTKNRVIVSDIRQDPLWDSGGYRALAAAHDLGACWSTPIMSPDGQVLGSFAMYYREPRSPTPAETRLVDIAARIAGIAIERSRAEEALRQKEAFFRMLTENANDVISLVDAGGRISYVSQARPSILGYQASDIEGTSAFDLVHPDDVEGLKRDVERALNGEPVITTCRGRRTDGSWRWLEAALRRVPYRGAPHVLSVTRDVTERKRAEQRQTLQYTVVRVLSEAATLADAVPHLLQGMCESLDWDLGEYWRLDHENHQLRHMASWHVPELTCQAFIERSRELTFGPGNGLPGRSWEAARTEWMPDVVTSRDFLRAAAAAAHGLHGAVAVPIVLASEVLGVMVLLSRERRDSDPSLLELLATIGRQIGQFVDRKRAEEARRESEEQIRYLAHHDPLTGLPNRALLHDRVNRAIAQARRDGHLVAMLFVDLDHFKHVNDSLGHQTGDRLLLLVASRLQGCLREVDTVARLGGDEFVISLAPLALTSEAAMVADKILFELSRPFVVEGHELHVSGSIGISLFPPDGQDAEALMRAADTAMYEAKGCGRRNYQFFSATLNDAVRQRLELANRLHRAVTQGEFVLHYQPQVDLESGAIIATEALLRWRQPEAGLVSCGAFVAVAEETALIVTLGEWALRQACQQLRTWRLAGLDDVRMAVNISPRQLRQPGCPDLVAQVLRENELPGAALDLEITESVLMLQSPENLKTLEQLAAMGVRLSVDDFGMGYSNLLFLRNFPVHALKIDRSFVDGIGRDPNDTAIVTTIIAMARSLKLHVVAEGVESREQIAFLKGLSCDAAQGYYYSQAVPAERLAELLHEQVVRRRATRVN